MEKREWKQAASNGTGMIYNALYRDETKKAKAIICIVHGMQSHSGRYIWLSEHLAKQGFVVILQDLQGHGKSANIPGSFGVKDGWEYMLHDLRKLLHRSKRWFSGIPSIVFGHSMGSFAARDYVAKYPDEFQGMILSGTAGSSSFYYFMLALLKTGILMHGSQAEARAYSHFLGRYFNRNVPNPVSPSSWCCSIDEVCIQHASDPLGTKFTIGAYYEMISSIIRVSGLQWAEKIPNIPVYIFSGGADPVGDYGKGPAEVYAWLKKTGHNHADLRIYPKKRHEILNEDIRWDAVSNINKWLEENFLSAL